MLSTATTATTCLMDQASMPPPQNTLIPFTYHHSQVYRIGEAPDKFYAILTGTPATGLHASAHGCLCARACARARAHARVPRPGRPPTR